MVAILGVLLVLQWRLIRLTVQNVLIAAIAFMLTLPMLGVGRYWGGADLAYEQGIPLVAIFGALWLILRPTQPSGRTAAALFVLGLIAGFGYISGAFAATAVALAVLIASRFAESADRSRLTMSGLSLGLAGSLAIVCQLWAIAGTPAAHFSALPSTPDFWVYVLGEITGGFTYPSYQNDSTMLTVAALFSVVAVLVLLLTFAWACRRVVHWRALGLRGSRSGLAILCISVAVGVYVGLASAARAHFGLGPNPSLRDVFVNGLVGHHTFWVTTLWPWVGVALIEIFRGRGLTVSGGRRNWYRATQASAAIVLLATILVTAGTGSYDYDRWFKGITVLRTQILSCLESKLNTGDPLVCLSDRPWDLTTAVLRAMSSDTSFARYLQFVPSPDAVPTIYRMSTSDDSQIIIQDASNVEQATKGWNFVLAGRGTADLATRATVEMQHCQVLEVGIALQAPSQIVLSASVSGGGGTATPLTPYRIVPGAATALSTQWLYLYSPAGFGDVVRLGFAGSGLVRLADVEVRCRMAR